jgi:peptide/nickel transport system substrate-binding protein
VRKVLVSLVLLVVVFSLGLGIVSVSFAQKYNEAPMLAELVRQGKLPPVEGRLPDRPVVIKPIEGVGKYGGTMYWHKGGLMFFLWIAPLVSLNEDFATVSPELAERWTISEDGKTYTIYIRPGIKWSDGQPFTTDDVIFWYEDIFLNKELTPVIPDALKSSKRGTPARIKKVDTYAFQVIFDDPNPLFLQKIGHGSALPLYAPSHYLSKFHPRYIPKEKLEAMAKEKGFDLWYRFFFQMTDPGVNPELPVLSRWKLKEQPSTVQEVWERNPYYYKVDSAGNQLPYIDRIVVLIIPTTETFLMKAMGGEIDFVTFPIPLSQYTILKENEAKGGYKVFLWDMRRGIDDGGSIYINQNVKDPVLRKLFQDKRFRIALSIAINRDEVRELAFLGFGKSRQYSLPSGVPFYDPEWEKAYAEYDPAKANKLLDEIGLIQRDAENFRLRPDGKTLAVAIEIPIWVDLTPYELVRSYWEKIGIKVVLKTETNELLTVRGNAGDTEIAGGLSGMEGGIWFVLNDLYGRGLRPWSPMWTLWYISGGKEGEEPGGEMKRAYEIWNEASVTVDKSRRDELLKEFFNIYKESLWLIGTVGETPRMGIVNNRIRNVRLKMPYGWGIGGVILSKPEQFFYEK